MAAAGIVQNTASIHGGPFGSVERYRSYLTEVAGLETVMIKNRENKSSRGKGCGARDVGRRAKARHGLLY